MNEDDYSKITFNLFMYVCVCVCVQNKIKKEICINMVIVSIP